MRSGSSTGRAQREDRALTSPADNPACNLLDLARSTLYYRKKPLKPRDLEMMRHIDQIHLAWPFYGSRRTVHELRGRGYKVGRGHASRLMKIMGIRAIWSRPRTTIP